MPAGDTTRINDTLASLANTNIVSLGERAAVHAFATAFINHRHPPANAGQPGYHAFANAMSLGVHLFADPNERRRMCRAIPYLLRRHHLTLFLR